MSSRITGMAGGVANSMMSSMFCSVGSERIFAKMISNALTAEERARFGNHPEDLKRQAAVFEEAAKNKATSGTMLQMASDPNWHDDFVRPVVRDF